jgi:hypothetical protein
MARNILRAAITKTSQVRLLRKPVVYFCGMLGLVLLLGGSALAIFLTRPKPQSAPTSHADLFMHSVVIEDGKLGWHQLCPSLQARLPLDELQQQAAEQKAANAKQNVTFTMKYLGSQTRPKGGEMRFYLVTAQEPDGWQMQRMYIVRTQSSGCVEDVQNIDLPGEEINE